MDVWVRHYLALLFDFKHYGNLNFLLIPLLIYFLATIKKRKRWEIAVAFVFILSCLLLGKKAVGHSRYILTLYPFALAVIFLLGWEFIKKKSHGLQIGILIICGIFVSFNYYQYREIYKFYWRYKVIVEDDHFPLEMLKFIDNIKDVSPDSATLVCAKSSLYQSYYYHTKKKGTDYNNPRMASFFLKKNKTEALDTLKNHLKIKYIFLGRLFKTPKILRRIISEECALVYQDEGQYLYMLREKDLNKEELEKLFSNDSLLKNGSFENWSHGPLKKPDFFEGGDNVFEGMVVREEKELRVGKYSARITGDNYNFTQNLSNFEDCKGKSLTCFAWVKTNVPDKYRIEIYDGLDYEFSNRHSGGGDWELLQANYAGNPLAKFLTVRVIQAESAGKVDDVVYVDGAILVKGNWNTFYLYKLHKAAQIMSHIPSVF